MDKETFRFFTIPRTKPPCVYSGPLCAIESEAMKTVIVSALFSVIGACSSAQNSFMLNSQVGSMTVMINEKEYSIDSIGTRIRTNYPSLDSLIFKADAPNKDRITICNFKPDSVYSVSMACCASLDIIPTSRLQYDSLRFWDYEQDFEKIQLELIDRPFISIRTLNEPRENIYAWHADAACETEHNLINTELWCLGIPPKCFYWSNITSIQFFKTDDAVSEHPRTDLEDFLSIDNIVELTAISFRLFDDGRFVIIYNEENNIATLQYE